MECPFCVKIVRVFRFWPYCSLACQEKGKIVSEMCIRQRSTEVKVNDNNSETG